MYGGMNQRTSFVQFLPLIGKHFIAAIHYLLIIPGNNFFFCFWMSDVQLFPLKIVLFQCVDFRR